MFRSIHRYFVPTLAALLLPSAAAQAETLLTLAEPEPYELQAIGFELDRKAELRIEATGMDSRDRGFDLNFWGRDDDEDELEVYAWIIDASSRDAVWVMRRQGSDRESGSLRTVDDRLTLEPGRYEVYLFSGLTWLDEAREAERSGSRKDREDGSWWERMFIGRGKDLDEIERDLRDCRVSVSLSTGSGQAAQDLTRKDVPRFEVTGELPGALIREAQVGDSELRVSGFELDRPMRLRVSALLEGERNGEVAADYGYILDEATREVVWQAELRRSDRGGGGSKNRRVDVEQVFEPGRYLLYYGTDDSHSFDEFNANPPYDPLNWGIAVFPGAEFEAQAFRTFVPGPLAQPLIDLSRAGDDVNYQQAFRLHTAGDLHILSLGEHVSDFSDLAWITDANGRTVWEMTKKNTRGAGGSAKNRMFDGLVSLAAGDYVLYYSSDGSHSYDGFNAAKPFSSKDWGVTVRPGPGFAPRELELIDVSDLEQKGEVVAKLVGVGDDDRQRQRFTLDRDTVVYIYALGEGQRGRMYDYGWIVDDDTGERVWEMEYRDTGRAGGDEKNRRFEGEVRLKAGKYVLVYETDGSHSFEGWNAASPRDPFNWGITLRRD